jgi:sec-independent protein translocase protein TatA
MPLPLALFSDVGGGEVMVIAVIALLLFGKNLPSVSRNIGRALAEFKRAASTATTEIQREMNSVAAAVEQDAPKPPAPFTVSATPVPRAPEQSMAREDAPRPASLDTAAPQPAPRPQPAVSPAAALDTLDRAIPAPVKIPPPIA